MRQEGLTYTFRVLLLPNANVDSRTEWRTPSTVLVRSG